MKRKLLLIIIFSVCIYLLYSAIEEPIDPYSIDDVSRLNATFVSEVIKPESEEDILRAVNKAIVSGKKVSIAGSRHSQGGHIVSDDGVFLDMKGYNKIIDLDDQNKVITVQSGATWEDIQNHINPYNLAVKVQQSSNIFSVGGSMSANIHGRDPRYSTLMQTIKSFRLVNAKGELINVSRSENSELFPLVIGGYGLFGVITQVQIELTDNNILEKRTATVKCSDYTNDLIHDIFVDKGQIELHYVRPNISPDKFLEECSVTSFYKIADNHEKLTKLQKERFILTSKFLLNLSRKGDFGKELRWYMQDTYLDNSDEVKIISRNNAMRPPVKFLEYHAKDSTDVLQEYFVPVSHATDFLNDLRTVLNENEVNLLSITLRTLKADKHSLLNYAEQDTLAFVLYINHGFDDNSLSEVKEWTQTLINRAAAHNGSYYLTYANYASREQLKRAYPKIDKFFELKKQYDPNNLFSNKFYENYN